MRGERPGGKRGSSPPRVAFMCAAAACQAHLRWRVPAAQEGRRPWDAGSAWRLPCVAPLWRGPCGDSCHPRLAVHLLPPNSCHPQIDEANYSLVGEGATLTAKRGGDEQGTSRGAGGPELPAAAASTSSAAASTSVATSDAADRGVAPLPALVEASWGFLTHTVSGVVGWAGEKATEIAASASAAAAQEEAPTPGTSQALAMLAQRHSASRSPSVPSQGLPVVAGQPVSPRPSMSASGAPTTHLAGAPSPQYHELDHSQAERRPSSTWYPAIPTAAPALASADLQDI